MNKSSIIGMVMGGGLSTEDLTEILYAVRKARRMCAKTRVSLFVPGDSVTFGTKGNVQTGVVTKVNKSSAIVECKAGSKKVSLISLKRM